MPSLSVRPRQRRHSTAGELSSCAWDLVCAASHTLSLTRTGRHPHLPLSTWAELRRQRRTATREVSRRTRVRAESNADSFLKRVLEGAVTGTDRDGRAVGSCLMLCAALLLALARVGDGVVQGSAYRSPACHPPPPPLFPHLCVCAEHATETLRALGDDHAETLISVLSQLGKSNLCVHLNSLVPVLRFPRRERVRACAIGTPARQPRMVSFLHRCPTFPIEQQRVSQGCRRRRRCRGAGRCQGGDFHARVVRSGAAEPNHLASAARGVIWWAPRQRESTSRRCPPGPQAARLARHDWESLLLRSRCVGCGVLVWSCVSACGLWRVCGCVCGCNSGVVVSTGCGFNRRKSVLLWYGWPRS